MIEALKTHLQREKINTTRSTRTDQVGNIEISLKIVYSVVERLLKTNNVTKTKSDRLFILTEDVIEDMRSNGAKPEKSVKNTLIANWFYSLLITKTLITDLIT